MLIKSGQVYPADPTNNYPEVAVYIGQVINECGSASATILTIEKQTPQLGTLFVRIDICDIPPVGGMQQVYVDAVCDLFTGNRRTMGGGVSSDLWDNTALDGNPKLVTRYQALCMFEAEPSPA